MRPFASLFMGVPDSEPNFTILSVSFRDNRFEMNTLILGHLEYHPPFSELSWAKIKETNQHWKNGGSSSRQTGNSNRCDVLVFNA